MSKLMVAKICHVPTTEGIQADLLFEEENGDKYPVRCLVRRPGMVELGENGDGSGIRYLTDRYSERVIFSICEDVTLRA